jgi:hypothetical protein
MDKVKAQASQLAEKATEAGKAGQAKIGTLQTKKQADTLLRDLGAHHFAKARGRDDAQTDTKIAGVMTQLDAHEAEHGQIDLRPDPMVQAQTDAAGGMQLPVSSIPGQDVVNVSAVDPQAVPIYGGGGIPSGNVGGIPSGDVGGIPSGNVGGIPSADTGGIPSGNVGGIPSGTMGGIPEANVEETPS